jgi:hypothetical protein
MESSAVGRLNQEVAKAMAYESTEVPVARSQEAIRRLIMARAGSKIAFISDPPQEGFEAVMMIDGAPYRVRIMATCKQVGKDRWKRERKLTLQQREGEERRVWRVLLYHLKSVFEAAESEVLEIQELLLPYIVVSDNRTIAEHILPRLAVAVAGNPARLLPAGGRVEGEG